MIQHRPALTSHIWLDDCGVAWVGDTNVKVIEVACERRGYGWLPEQMMEQHPGLFTLGELHSALAFYYDHQAEIDAEIDRQDREFEIRRTANANHPAIVRLRSEGKLP